MIAADTSSLIAYFGGATGADIELVEHALAHKQLLLPPVVLTELLSDPKLTDAFVQSLVRIPTIETGPGYWERAGRTRAKVLAKGRKARIADALIAQSCLDEGIPLVTRDRDFQGFAKLCGLELLG